MDGGYMVMMVAALAALSVARRDRSPRDEARAREEWREFPASFARWIAPVVIGLGGAVAGVLIFEWLSGKKASAPFAMIAIIAVVAANAFRPNQAPTDECRAAERRRTFRATAAMLIAPFILVYAVMAAGMAAVLLFALIVGHEPWTPFAVFMTLALTMGAAGLGGLGMALLRGKHLLRRLGRARAAAVEAFREPVHDTAKPKPTIDPDMD